MTVRAAVLPLLCATICVSEAKIVTFDFSDPPVLAASQQPAAWFPDRKAPAVFNNADFLGDSRLQIGISASDYNGGNIFYNTQGRKYDITIAPTGSISAQLYIPAAWQNTAARSDLWATGVADDPLNATAYIIFGFTSLDGTPRLRTFDSDIGWINLDTTVVYDSWVTLRVDYTPTSFVYSINGTQVYTDANVNGTTHLQDVMLQAYNPNATYNAYWDNLTIDTAIPDPPAVPEPATSLLFLAGGFLVLGRRTRNSESNV